MKSGTLCLFKIEEQFNPLLGITFIKERFRNGDFINENWVTIAQQDELSRRCDVLFEIMEENLILKCTMKEFHSTHKDSISIIKKVNENHKLSLSWFEILQLAAMCEFNKNLDEKFILDASINLCQFYNQVIKTFDF